MSDKDGLFEVNENSYYTNNTLSVVNKHKGTLPLTGGIGSIIFMVVGIIRFSSMVVYFKRRFAPTSK